MNKETLLAEIAKKHQELTATPMTNSSFCFPANGNPPTFTVSWNHNCPPSVMLYIYHGKCEFSYGSNGGSNNPTVFLDSTGQQGGYAAQTVNLTGEGNAIDLMNFINMATASQNFIVGVSW
ncbi:MAG: hypothetical protein GC180_12640 [Bacteroidetes bacterium]|nr:hypothetical protein [Bacteroidota bacterium]